MPVNIQSEPNSACNTGVVRSERLPDAIRRMGKPLCIFAQQRGSKFFRNNPDRQQQGNQRQRRWMVIGLCRLGRIREDQTG